MKLYCKKSKDRYGYDIYSAKLVITPNVVLEVKRMFSVESAIDTILGMCVRLESTLRHLYTDNDTSELIKTLEHIFESSDEHTFEYDENYKRIGG